MKLSGSQNVIIRNLKIQGVSAHDDEDCLQVNHESKNVWIDHVDIYDGHDGNLDITNASDYVTISWTKFSYTSKSFGPQFSNLIGNSKTKTSDKGRLNVTIHHTWWADGVVERMPNVIIGVQKALDLYTSDGSITAVQMINNYEENVKKHEDDMSTAFKPSYSMSLTDVSTQSKAYALRDSIKLYAGATLSDPGASSTLAKHGSGSSNQTVAQGASIAELYFTIVGATGAVVTGLPEGVNGTLKGSDVYIAGTVSKQTYLIQANISCV